MKVWNLSKNHLLFYTSPQSILERLSGNRKVAGSIPSSPKLRVDMSLSKTPINPSCSWRAGRCLAWLTPPLAYECVYKGVNVRQYCKALSLYTVYSINLPFTYGTSVYLLRSRLAFSIYIPYIYKCDNSSVMRVTPPSRFRFQIAL